MGQGEREIGGVYGHIDVIGQFSLGVLSFYHDGPSNFIIKLNSKAGLTASSSSFVSLCGSKCSGLMPSVSRFRSASGVYLMLLCHENEADLALFCAHAPSAGTPLPRPSGDHCHHQQIRYDFYRIGSPVFSRI